MNMSGAELIQLINPDFFIQGFVIYFFIVWFCLVIWVVRDITNRTHSLFFQVFSILLVLFLTPLGIFVYLLLRPQKTLFEKIFEDEFLKIDTEEKTHPTNQKYSSGIDIKKKGN